MSDKRLFKGWVNPLAFLEVDQPWAQINKEPITFESIIKYICTPGLKSDLQSLIDRYKEISLEPARLSIAPVENRILTKLVWPLRQAKACYMTGNYLGTIALCGMVAEMVAILLFDISDLAINGKKLTKEDEIGFWGSEFEKLNQERRVSILRTYNLIDDQIKSSFNLIRTKRRGYLHISSQDHSTLASDAVEVFKAASTVVIKAIGQDIDNGKILLNPALIRYLEKEGHLFDASPEHQPGMIVPT